MLEGKGEFFGHKVFFLYLFHILKSHVYPSFWLKFLEQPLSLKKRERVIMERDGNWFRWIILVLGLCVVYFFFTIVSSIPLVCFFFCRVKRYIKHACNETKTFKRPIPIWLSWDKYLKKVQDQWNGHFVFTLHSYEHVPALNQFQIKQKNRLIASTEHQVWGITSASSLCRSSHSIQGKLK